MRAQLRRLLRLGLDERMPARKAKHVILTNAITLIAVVQLVPLAGLAIAVCLGTSTDRIRARCSRSRNDAGSATRAISATCKVSIGALLASGELAHGLGEFCGRRSSRVSPYTPRARILPRAWLLSRSSSSPTRPPTG